MDTIFNKKVSENTILMGPCTPLRTPMATVLKALMRQPAGQCVAWRVWVRCRIDFVEAMQGKA